MQQFFVPGEELNKDYVELTGENFKHLVKVLRMTTGEKILLADGSGKQFEAEISTISQEKVTAQIIAESKVKREADTAVTLIQVLPKKEKMELIIQKGTELGIKEILPVESQRSVVKINSDKKRKSKVERWQKIAEEASKQCQRPVIPKIKDISTLKEALQSLNVDRKLFLWEGEENNTLRASLNNIESRNCSSIAVIIGPEGGFSPEEVETARNNGCEIITAGSRILRTETAGIAVVTMILYHLGDLGG